VYPSLQSNSKSVRGTIPLIVRAPFLHMGGMILLQRIMRHFVPDCDAVHEPHVRSAYGKLASSVGIAMNVLLFGAKLLAGTISGSVSIVADAVNNLSDASSSVISLLGFKLADKPADEEHPYGHGRYEYVAGLMVAVLIMVIGVELFRSGLDKILHPEPVSYSVLSIVILIVSIAVKLWMMFFNRRIGKLISSGALFATAADSRNDAITTTVVLCAALISRITHIELDGWMALAVAIFILINGFTLIRDTISPMLGKAPDPEFVERIRKKILRYPGVLGTHDLMVHDYGPGRQFGSVHVEMAAEDDVMTCHDVLDNIERDMLRDEGLHLIVHYDPIVTDDCITGDIRRWLSQQIEDIDPCLSIHDLRVVQGPSHTNLVFDCVVPHAFTGNLSALRQQICETVQKSYPNYYCVINFDRSYVPISQ
jgi:cation diffusion facilitator family transporter